MRNDATMRGGRYGADAARKRQAAVVHRGAARRAAQGARSEIELSRGGGLPLGGDTRGCARRQDGGGAHEPRHDAAVPRRRDGGRRGDDRRGAGGGDVSGWHEARDGAQSHRVMMCELKIARGTGAIGFASGEKEEEKKKPGENNTDNGNIESFVGRATGRVTVGNTGDRPI